MRLELFGVHKRASAGIPDCASIRSKVWLLDGVFTLSFDPLSDAVATFVRSLSLGFYCTMLTHGLAHRSPSSSLRSEEAPPSYSTFPSNHSTSSNASSNSPPPPYTHPFAAPGPSPVPPPVFVPHPKKRTTIVISRGLTICLAVILLQSVLIICRSDVLARYIDLDAAAYRASREKSALMVEREKSERERMRWEQERDMLKRERLRSELEREELQRETKEFKLERNELGQEKVKLEQERQRWERERQMWEWERGGWEVDKEKWEMERGQWERDKGEWKSEREKLEQEKEKLRLEREWWERAREDRVPQGAFWEVVWPAWDCRAYGKREYWGALQNIPDGWTAMDACTNMPVEIKGVTIRRPDRCAFVEGSPHIHGYWMVDWDQPDCKPWYRDFHDAVSPISPPHLYVIGMITRLRDAQATGLAIVGSRLSSWASTTGKNKIGGCCAAPHLWSGTRSRIRAPPTVRVE